MDPKIPNEPKQKDEPKEQPLEYDLRKYLLVLATIVATVTYAAGFNPPGGVWQDNDAGYLAGDPIIRTTHYRRYLVFFYCNAAAFASSILVIVLVLVLAILRARPHSRTSTLPLRVVMGLDVLGLMGAYAAGTSRGEDTTRDSWVLFAVSFSCVVLQVLVASWPTSEKAEVLGKKHRKVLMLLATFVASITYISGLSTPGGFWESSQDGHRAGDPILREHHSLRLKAFFYCNTTAFVASLLIIVLLLDKKLHKSQIVRCRVLYAYVAIALFGLIGAYAFGSCRETDTTIYVVSLAGIVLAVQLVIFYLQCGEEQSSSRSDDAKIKSSDKNNALNEARSLVILLATLVATVSYQAGLVPPGGVWQENGDGHKAGDPILLSTNPKRYNVFFYCNSTAFVASLVVIILVQYKSLLRRHTLEVAMILDLFGLMGAYAAGSCRDVSTSIYVIALAGAVLVYVVIHVVFFTLEEDFKKQDDDDVLHKRRKRLLLFAVLGATLTYQAGLTPPSGFQLEDDDLGHHAGDPILFHNYPRRYKAFFYCNSVSFMSSIALIILLVNPNLYRPAIRSYALSVCTGAGLIGVMGAYASGSTQHLKTSIYVLLVAVVLSSVVILWMVCWKEKTKENNAQTSNANTGNESAKGKRHAKRKFLMLLGVLAASVTYQAGLNPPGSVWQDNSNGHAAGDPVMHDTRRGRYLTFFFSNSTSFMASVVVIMLLMPKILHEKKRWLKVMKATVVLDLICLLVAYAAGSTTEWQTSGHVIALIVPAMACVLIPILLSFKPENSNTQENSAGQAHQQQKEGNSLV
ncbi:hypothetical protein ACP70R_047329 [Stipagrostis hirtigluma subsp. patula]